MDFVPYFIVNVSFSFEIGDNTDKLMCLSSSQAKKPTAFVIWKPGGGNQEQSSHKEIRASITRIVLARHLNCNACSNKTWGAIL